MAQNYNERPPQIRKTRKRGNGRLIITFIFIAILTVALSGAAGYLGTKLAAGDAVQESFRVESEDASDHQVLVEAVDVSNVVARVRPSVVEITTEVVSNGTSLFGQYISQGAGSGVIISSDGYIATNHHVIDGATAIKVTLYDGQTYDATLVGSDEATDTAVVKVDAAGLSAAVIGNSDSILVGEPVIAVGNPLGSLGGTVTTGIISAVGREITIENENMTLLQTDAAINPGNSGGGLFNASGELVGIVNAKQSATGIEGLGFAIPISDVTQILEELIQSGTVISRPFLNVSLQDITGNTFYGLSSKEPGVYIAQIVEGGAADRAGLQVGDRLTAVNGTEVSTAAEVKKAIRTMKIGDTAVIDFVRDGQEESVEVVLGGSTPQ